MQKEKRTGSVPVLTADSESHPHKKRVWHRVLWISVSYFLPEVLAAVILRPELLTGLAFALVWAFVCTAVTLLLPCKAGRIFYGLSYYTITVWTLAQTGYHCIFDKLMWLSDITYAGEGADYLDVLLSFPIAWWVGGVLLLALGVVGILSVPKGKRNGKAVLSCLLALIVSITGLWFLPELVFLRDKQVWGTNSEFARATSCEAAYTTLYDARRVYDFAGLYQLTARDLWVHALYPMTPQYRRDQKAGVQQVTEWFDSRPKHTKNYKTGLFEGKNVILILMESMDDWMITPEDTPTICGLMDEGISFENFYTPGFGSVRTFNSEFCSNTGLFLPTNGSYAFDYVTNHFRESMAAQLTARGYSAEVFHYNSPDFYSRGVFEPAMGYRAYNSYESFVEDEQLLYSDELLFDIPEMEALFFREGPRLNTIITRSAHMTYTYNEVLSAYAMRCHPEYRTLSEHEEENCARAKARLVDEFFARLLSELEKHGELENTLIVAYTDHYTYGFQDEEKLLELSGVTEPLLLEKTPFFLWAADCPNLTMKKTGNTADILPTVLNLLGIESDYPCLGRDIFDWKYEGFAFFPDGSWACDGVIYQTDGQGGGDLLQGEADADYLAEMTARALEFAEINNLILTTDYYKTIKTK